MKRLALAALSLACCIAVSGCTWLRPPQPPGADLYIVCQKVGC